ncbi:hypothetical protein [Streptomyces sp. NBC_00467]|uniref:hypothetical protein n=1 Tax=Streptomyces sp. NBC_00467 TaxID=2975752 RepID=UPI002E182A48
MNTPDTDATWASLTETTLASIKASDARRLSVERSRVAPDVREKITEPVYSLKNRFSFWERLIRRMEADWQVEGQYPISAYSNDLECRELQVSLSELPDTAQPELAGLLRALDARFMHRTEPDGTGELRPWLRPSSGTARHGFWLRKPVVVPW